MRGSRKRGGIVPDEPEPGSAEGRALRPARAPPAYVVVVVNYRASRLVAELLASLPLAGGTLLGCVIVDNDSGPDEWEQLCGVVEGSRVPIQIEVIRAPRNGGFAYGNNMAISVAQARWPSLAAVMLLNPDTRVSPGALGRLASLLGSRPDCGIVGARISDDQGLHQCSAHLGDGVLRELANGARLKVVEDLLSTHYGRVLPGEDPVSCDWVSGACMMIRRSVLDSVGPMDEGFFLYFEEMDYCRRARRRGWTVCFEPRAHVVHHEGASTKIREGRRPAYWFASRRRYLRKHRGLMGLVVADVAFILGWFVGGTARWILRRTPVRRPPRFVRDLVIGDVTAVLQGDL